MTTATQLTDTKDLKALFIYYLDKIYDGKCYLKGALGNIKTKTSLKILKHAIDELGEDVEVQLERMTKVYEILDAKPSKKFDAPMKAIIQNACEFRHSPDMVVVNDMDIMVHMQLVEHVNMVSYRILKKIADLLGYEEIEKLMKECFDESRDDDKLFFAISKEYLGD